MSTKRLFSSRKKKFAPPIEPDKQLTLSTFVVNIPKIIVFLVSTIAVLMVGHLLEGRFFNWLNLLTNAQLTPHLFTFDAEANFPSLFSGVILALASLLLAVIAMLQKTICPRYIKYWRALSWIFLYIAIDEVCSIHELLIPILRGLFNTRGVLYFPWVIPAAILLTIFLIVFKDFILNLPPKTRSVFLLAGTVYVSGALGMEVLGGYLGDTIGFNTKAYWIVSTIEELLEMFGVVIFIYGLLSYIQSHLEELNFSLSFKQQK